MVKLWGRPVVAVVLVTIVALILWPILGGTKALVAYALAITDVCPVKYNLLFERFLNPDRKSMPDLDIDFSDEGRERVIPVLRPRIHPGQPVQDEVQVRSRGSWPGGACCS